MSKKENEPKANKPKRESDNIEKTDLPYDPNINRDDEFALNPKGHSMDRGQDKDLADREESVDFTAKNLDIPGRDERDTTHKNSGNPDEENHQFNEKGVRPDELKDQEHPNPDRKIPE